MILPDFALDYNACTTDELQSFTKARGLTLPRRDFQKDALISWLRKGDRTATFKHLFDLPPEIQCLIYLELLTLRPMNGRRRKCWPQILSVSRQIHEEAEALLYEQNLFQISLFQIVHSRRNSWAAFPPAEGVYVESDFHAAHSSIRSVRFTHWPWHIRKVRHLEVNMTVNGLETMTPADMSLLNESLFEGLSTALFNLFNFLNCTHSLKEMSIQFHASDVLGVPSLMEIKQNRLWSLHIFPKLVAVFEKREALNDLKIVVEDSPISAELGHSAWVDTGYPIWWKKACVEDKNSAKSSKWKEEFEGDWRLRLRMPNTEKGARRKVEDLDGLMERLVLPQ